jgi:hypothetical protein
MDGRGSIISLPWCWFAFAKSEEEEGWARQPNWVYCIRPYIDFLRIDRGVV